jgi:hypothetical protein
MRQPFVGFFFIFKLQYINVHEFNAFKPLRYLSGRKFILMRFPETAATHVFRMMAYAMPLESYIWIAHRIFRLFKVKRAIRPVYAGGAHFLLNAECHLFASSKRISA